MSFKKTLIFFMILLVLGGYYYIAEVKIASQKQAAEEAERQLFDLADRNIQSLTLKRGEQEIVLEKQGENWKMTQPVEAAADEEEVDIIVNTLEKAERDKRITDKAENIADFGLDAPGFTVSIQVEGRDTPSAAHFGDETPTASGYYVQPGDEPAVMTVAKATKDALDKEVYDLRDKTILAFEPAGIASATFTIRDQEDETVQTISLEQQDDLWKIVEPREYAADQSTMSSLLSKIKNSQVQEFITEASDDLSQYGLDAPKQSLALVVDQDHSRKTLLLGDANEPKQGIYAKHETDDTIFLVPQDIVEQFPADVNDLRDKTLLSLKTSEELAKIEIVKSDETIVLTPETEDAWKITHPVEYQADMVRLRNLVGDARNLKIQTFVDDAPQDLAQYGLDAPRVTLRFWEKGQEAPQELLLGNQIEDSEQVYAKTGDQANVVLVHDSALESLNRSVHDLRYKRLLTFERDQAQKIRVTSSDTTLIIEKDDDQWNATEPEEAELEIYKVNNLIYDLRTLEFAEEYLEPEADLSVYGLDAPEYEVTAWDADGQELGTLLIGKAVEGRDDLRYAKTASGTTVYGIDATFPAELPTQSSDLLAD